MPRVFVPRECQEAETRTAATPETVRRMVKLGLDVSIEQAAGELSHFSDQAYQQAGATIVAEPKAAWSSADIVLKINPPAYNPALGQHEVDLMRRGTVLISHVWSVQNPALAKKIAAAGLSCIAMEAVPRISRAQKMDALSSQANLAGYKAVLKGADALGRVMPMMITAAGTLKPATVVVMGAGVAGLQAIATARRLGAIVQATDIRPEVKEQVESLGARFIDTIEAAGEGGYAKALTDEQKLQQQQTIASHLVAADLVITTALVPGRKAPVLIPATVVEQMKPGAVIVDLAVSQGGNCELSEVGRVVRHGVTIIGVPDLPALLPTDASSMFSRNLLAVVSDIIGRKTEAKIVLDLQDEVIAASLIIHGGEIRHRPTREAVEGLQGAAS